MERPRSVAPGVEVFPVLTPTLLPATHTNSYALGTRDVLLVEPSTPYDEERAAWLAWARGLASQGRRLVGIFLTHHHADHVGGAAFFREALGVPTLAHPRTAAFLAANGQGTVDRELLNAQSIDLEGPTPQRWRVLHTPGHASGHLCLHEETEGSVVVGDMVASVGTILIAPGDGDMIEYLAQLRRLEALGARVALPAHGDPIEEPSRLFRAYVAHRLMREARIKKALEAAGEVSVDVLVRTAYGDTPESVWPIAKLSLEAHLEKLLRDGAVVRNADGLWRVAPSRAPH